MDSASGLTGAVMLVDLFLTACTYFMSDIGHE